MKLLAISLALLGQAAEEAADEATESNIETRVSGDLDADGITDTAYITSDLRLVIESSRVGQVEYGRVEGNFGWGGRQPNLSISEAGSLVLGTLNLGGGSSRWEQWETMAFRDGEFVLAGITYWWRDSLDPTNEGTCDVNLLTGQGVRKGESITTEMAAIAVTEIGNEYSVRPPSECRVFEPDYIYEVGDVDGDGIADRVGVLSGRMSLGLRIESSLVGVREFPGLHWGGLKSLSVTEHGSFQVHVFAGTRHEHIYTIAYRDDAFRVAGRTHLAEIGYDPVEHRRCDVNFLTGRGVLDGESFSTDTPAESLAEMTTAGYHASIQGREDVCDQLYDAR